MAAHPAPKALPAIRPHRWTRADFDKMGLADIFHPEARVELIDGEILHLAPLPPLDATAIQLVQTMLRNRYGKDFMVSTQLPLALSNDSQPVPDVTVCWPAPRLPGISPNNSSIGRRDFVCYPGLCPQSQVALVCPPQYPQILDTQCG